MSFAPAIPLGGLAGLRFLERTGEAQREAHARSPEIQRNIAYFAENISKIKTAEEFVADRQLMAVALGAFGLQDEIDKKAFVKRILEEGVETSDTLGSRLNNQNYIDMTRAFRFDRNGFPLTGSPDLRDSVIAKYLEQSFEVAVGEQSEPLRLALDFKRRAGDIADRGWYALLGDLPTRAVLETALGIPSDVAGIDVDKQKALFEERALSVFGSKDPAMLKDPAVLDRVVSRFMVLDEALSGPSALTPGYSALTLLSNASSGFGPLASQSLFQSSF